jgi:predicted amidophosphoribosyltransferase
MSREETRVIEGGRPEPRRCPVCRRGLFLDEVLCKDCAETGVHDAAR